MEALAVIGVIVLIALGHHGKHYRRHRRNGFGVWYSMRGPWGTGVTVRKRF